MAPTTVEQAIRIAIACLDGQTDLSGEPCIFHPMRVAMQVPSRLRPAAVLHDVIADTPFELSTLRTLVDERTWQLVGRLTLWDPCKRTQHIARICDDPDAAAIEVAHIRDNVDHLDAVDEPTRERLLRQLRADLELLEAAGYETRQSVGQEALIDRR